MFNSRKLEHNFNKNTGNQLNLIVNETFWGDPDTQNGKLLYKKRVPEIDYCPLQFKPILFLVLLKGHFLFPSFPGENLSY